MPFSLPCIESDNCELSETVEGLLHYFGYSKTHLGLEISISTKAANAF